jgi:hypothetical protein
MVDVVLIEPFTKNQTARRKMNRIYSWRLMTDGLIILNSELDLVKTPKYISR